MDRAELEATCKEAMQHMGATAVIAYLIDWSERAFYEQMAHDIMDEMTEAAAREAARAGK